MPTKSQISIVIAAFNEEKYIGKLLEDVSISAPDAQVIVADAGSYDRTIHIAESFRRQVGDLQIRRTDKIKPGPGATRNTGAKAVEGNIIFFLDADGRVKPKFFPNAITEFKARALQAAGCQITPDSDDRWDHMMWDATNRSAVANQIKSPGAMGAGMVFEKELFKKIGGFREDLPVCEDRDISIRAANAGQFGMLVAPDTDVITSVRRFERHGRIRSNLSWHLNALYYRFTGNVPSHKFGFKFGGK